MAVNDEIKNSALVGGGLKKKLLDKKEVPTTPIWVLNVVYFIHEGARMLLLRFMTAYFTHAGVSTASVGLLQAMGTLLSFCGEWTWANVNDSYFSFKTTVLMCNTIGIAFFLCIPLTASLPVLCVLYGCASFCLSWVGIRDAFAVTMLEFGASSAEEGAKKFGKVRKFAAVGWGTSGLLTGLVADHFGLLAVFAWFAATEAVLTVTILVGVQPEVPAAPSQGGLVSAESMADLQNAPSLSASRLSTILRKDYVMLFFSNVLIYGIMTSLQEVYEFVYLLKGFKGASNTLLGATLCVMTLAELPVFHFADKLISAGFVSVYTACQALMAIRCLLYAALPYDMPWLVLIIEPFHGVTFAAMWAASVEFARREAPQGCRSRMQALVSGTYFQMSQGVGALAWGGIISLIGFRPSYQACAFGLVIWGLIWNGMVAYMGQSPLKDKPTSTCSCMPYGSAPPLKRLRTGSFYRRMAPTQTLGSSSQRGRSTSASSRLPMATVNEGLPGA